jgi:hypothetical protein
MITNAANGISLRSDDHGSDASSASPIVPDVPGDDLGFTVPGTIERPDDADYFLLTTIGGKLDARAFTYTETANLDVVLELRRSDGNLLIRAMAEESDFLTEAIISTPLPAGSYYLVVRGSGGYGNVGQYVLRAGTQGHEGGDFERIELPPPTLDLPSRGDFNSDRLVDHSDLLILVGAFGDLIANFTDGDSDGDGDVDGADMLSWQRSLGAPSEIVPAVSPASATTVRDQEIASRDSAFADPAVSWLAFKPFTDDKPTSGRRSFRPFGRSELDWF